MKMVNEERNLLYLLDKKEKIEDHCKFQFKSRIISMCTLLLSIPALIGGWCWPAILLSLVGVGASNLSRSIGHYISFGLTFFMMLAVFYLVLSGKRRRKGTFIQVWGPLLMMGLSFFLVMSDQTRHLLQDIEVWPSSLGVNVLIILEWRV